MKAVLISIQPKWVEKIASGEKTIEVRKTKPKLETPFKVYIYCTKGQPIIFESDGLVNGDIPYFYNGYVMGEFVCDRIDSWKDHEIHITNLIKLSCVSLKELDKYSKGGKENLYGWHISDLKIYDNPKELNEFKRWNRTEENVPCAHTKWLYPDCKDCKVCNLTRPPQSWCRVEELK